MVAEIHAEAAFDDEEHFVFVLVVMKDEYAFELVEFHILAVEFCSDVGLPVFGDFGEFFGDVYFWHGILESTLEVWMNRCEGRMQGIAFGGELPSFARLGRGEAPSPHLPKK